MSDSESRGMKCRYHWKIIIVSLNNQHVGRNKRGFRALRRMFKRHYFD